MKLKKFLNLKVLGVIAATLTLGDRIYADSDSQRGQDGSNPPTIVTTGSKLPIVNILATDPTALEGTSSGSFTLLISPASSVDLAVDLLVSGTASNGVDYSMISNVITIPAGSLAVDIPVTPLMDTAHRGNKTVQLAIGTNSAYMRGGYRKATVEIIDDTFNIPKPSITVTNPIDGSKFTNPPSIMLQAEVNDTDIPVQGVSFYVNDFFLGRTTTSPYSLVWTNPTPGLYAVFARMTDQLGHSAISAPVHVTVVHQRTVVIPPQVSISSPTNHQRIEQTTPITIQAQVTDADPSAVIQNVNFYAGDKLLGTATTSPYSLVWSNAPLGAAILRAVATDQNGLKGYSSPVSIEVYPAPPAIP